VKFFGGERYQDVKHIMRTLDLHTVCESARCPTWASAGTRHRDIHDSRRHLHARLRVLCRAFGEAVGPPDEEEPFRVAEAVAKMGLRYAVVTSVNRDEPARRRRAHFCAHH